MTDVRHQRILVVDDDPDSRQRTRAILASDGPYEFQEAADGQAALDACERFRPDLIVLDLQMPGMDGWTALPKLRKLLPEATIIIHSSVADLDSLGLRALGAHACISKGSRPAEFVTRVRSVLRGA